MHRPDSEPAPLALAGADAAEAVAEEDVTAMDAGSGGVREQAASRQNPPTAPHAAKVSKKRRLCIIVRGTLSALALRHPPFSVCFRFSSKRQNKNGTT